MSAITTHVLDTSRGRPASGVSVRMERVHAAGAEHLADGVTDSDGRVRDLGPDNVEPDNYRLLFDTASYFAATGQSGFFPEVVVTFTISDVTQHHHVPVLLSPFAYSTYRGS